MRCYLCNGKMLFDGSNYLCKSCGISDSDQEEFYDHFTGDYNDLHPDETEEEFWEHED